MGGPFRWDHMGWQDHLIVVTIVQVLSLNRKLSGLTLPKEMQKMLMSK